MDTAVDQESGPAARRPAWVYVPYRVLITLAQFLVLLEPVLAGQFLSGKYGALQWHQNVAALIDMVLIVATVAAVLIKWPGHGPFWPIFVPPGLLVLTYTQNQAGFHRVLALHVPLGVLIILVMVPLTIWTWLPRPGRSDRTSGSPELGARDRDDGRHS